MASKKKKKKKKKTGRGKAKKATDSSKQKGKQQGESLDAPMEEFKIGGADSQADDEASLLEEAIKLAAAEKEALKSRAGDSNEMKRKIMRCHHGYDPGEDHAIIYDRAQTFWSGFNSLDIGNTGKRLGAAQKAIDEKYPELWEDSYMMKMVASWFLFQGTHNLLVGKMEGARHFAFIACHLQDYVAVYIDKSKVIFDAAKQIELLQTDEHTLVKYLRKNIPCTCLDEKYKEVKSITRMGLCCNPQCSLPNRMAKRSTMLCCDRCRYVSYCSRSCQKADWPLHKDKDCFERQFGNKDCI
jgi:hypothetical protein